ncbi:MAG: carboxypeptidase-like regulatory domain-containing protein [Schlesneria sp.]
MPLFGTRWLFPVLLFGLASTATCLSSHAVSGADQTQDEPEIKPKAEEPFSLTRKNGKQSLSSIGRPASQGPLFPTSFAPSLEEREKLQSTIDALIPQLGAENLETREKATRELQAISNYSRAAIERAVNHANNEISRRSEVILSKFPKHTHVVVDALSNPIQYAKVTFTFVPRSASNANRATVLDDISATVPVEEAEARVVGDWTDEYGRIAVPQIEPAQIACLMQIQHSDYGIGRCEVLFWGPHHQLRLPFVPRNTEFRKRALTGTIVAPDGQPVAAAVVTCDHVRTAGEGLINGAFPRGEVLTDENGQFSFYLPNDNPDRSRGDIIPPNSRYHATITKPDDDSYFPVTGMFSNAEPVRIEIPKPTRLHRFRFEAAKDNWLEKPEHWMNLTVQRVDANRQSVRLDPRSLFRGRRVLEGTYKATFFDNGRAIHFEPLKIDQDSPVDLIFRLPNAITYYGRVVHGVTGAAIPDAIVFAWSSTSRNNLALLAEDDWKLLDQTPSNPPLDHPAIKLLNKFYGTQGLVRTDRDGRFEFVKQPDREFYGLMAVDPNSVPFMARIGSLKPDAKQRIDVLDFPLYPAAKVIVCPIFGGDRLPILPRWLPTQDDQPDWFSQFQAIKPGSDREFEYVHWLTINERQPIHVPAGLQMRMRFESPYNDEWSPALIDKPFRLEAGTVTDLGELHFAASLPVEVQVTNSAGQPIEGFAVRRKHDSDGAWCVAHNTDEHGKAFFHVHSNSTGEFRVTDLQGPKEITQAENLSAKFTVSEKPPKQPFRITVTDEQIAVLKKQK